jgi:16S rRNA A1518/A1519 N6-dimethyltransferase RsmA/KsgA/DIM1 with predicted DNA glycosylase/AP lyase activity
LIAFERLPESVRPVADENVTDYARFLKDSFTHRRKTLANNLLSSRSIPRESVVEMLAEIGHGPSARPQELEPYEFASVFSRVRECG